MKRLAGLDVRGDFALRVFHNDGLIAAWRAPNLIVDGAKDALARLLGGDDGAAAVSEIGFGTSASAPAASDTALTAPFRKEVAAVHYLTGGVRFDWVLTTAEANGTRIREFGLFAGDTLIARRVGDVQKTAHLALEGRWTIRF